MDHIVCVEDLKMGQNRGERIQRRTLVPAGNCGDELKAKTDGHLAVLFLTSQTYKRF